MKLAFLNRLATRVLLTLAILLLFIGLVMAWLVQGGFRHTETRAVQRSAEGLEEQGGLALMRLAQVEAALIDARLSALEDLSVVAADQVARAVADIDRGAEIAPAGGENAARGYADLARSAEGHYYDANPARRSDVFIPGFLEPTAQRERLLAASATLDRLLPVLYERAEGTAAIYYYSVEAGLRYFPVIDVHEAFLAGESLTPELWGELALDVDPMVTPGRETTWGTPYMDTVGQGLMVTLHRPIYLQDEPLGIIGIDVLLDDLVQRLEAMRPTSSSYAFLVDDEGRLVAAPARALPHLFPGADVGGGLEELLGEEVYDQDSVPVAGQMAPLLANETGLARLSLGGEEMLFAQAALEEVGWTLAIVSPLAEVTAPAESVAAAIAADAGGTLNRVLLTMGAFLLLALGAAAMLTQRRLVRPVEALAAGSRLIAGGDLETRVALQEENELGELANAFNQMASELAESQRELELRVADRTRELGALYDVTAVASASLDLEEVLSRSLQQVLAVMSCESATIHLWDDADGLLRLEMQKSQGERLPSEAPLYEGPLLACGEGLAGAIYEQQRPVVVMDLNRSQNGALLSTEPEEAMAFVGAPMNANGRVVGVISLFCRSVQDFSAEEVALLGSIADQVGIAVENARLHRQTRQLAVIQERQRLARELHDAVTQSLYSVTLLAEATSRAAARQDLETVVQQSARLGEIGQQALKEMRLLVYELRPLALAQEGLIAALQQRLDAVEQRAGLDARLLVDMEPDVVIPARLEAPLYRISQEALNNALKHAGATAVSVEICADERQLMLTIADNGCGFDAARVGKGGLGLQSMRERATEVGGDLQIEAAEGGGTVVRVTTPLDEKDEREKQAAAGA